MGAVPDRNEAPGFFAGTAKNLFGAVLYHDYGSVGEIRLPGRFSRTVRRNPSPSPCELACSGTRTLEASWLTFLVFACFRNRGKAEFRAFCPFSKRMGHIVRRGRHMSLPNLRPDLLTAVTGTDADEFPDAGSAVWRPDCVLLQLELTGLVPMVLGSSGWAPIVLPKDIGALAKMLVPGAIPVIVCTTLLATIRLP